MKENIIIETTKYNVKRTSIIAFILLCIIGLIVAVNKYERDCFLWVAEENHWVEKHSDWTEEKKEEFKKDNNDYYQEVSSYSFPRKAFSMFGKAITNADENYIIFIIVAGVFLLILCYFYKNSRIIVYNTKVSRTSMFGTTSDIPINSISSVGKNDIFKGIILGSSSGKIHSLFIKNYYEIYNKISELINKR